MMKWFRRPKAAASQREPATNAQIGYVLSLLDELEMDCEDIEVVSTDGSATPLTREMLHTLQKGDASVIITALRRRQDEGVKARGPLPSG